MAVAIVHTLFNSSGILGVYPRQALRRIPIRLANGLSDSAVEHRSTAIAYAIGMFGVVPLLGVLLLR